jgi:5'-nucleotidase
MCDLFSTMHLNSNQKRSIRRASVFSFFSLYFSMVTALSGCSTSQTQSTARQAEIEQSPKSSADIEHITILGTNDIHGGLAPLELKTREPQGGTPVHYEAGGAAYLASYVKKLRSELGDRLIWLDAGDEFQGTIESNLNHGAAMVKFFNSAGLNAAAVGNHEFDFGAEPADPSNTDRLSALKHRMSEANYPYLAANIYDHESGKIDPLPNTYPSKIFQAGRIKVGVIGLSTIDTPTTTRPENIQTLKFTDLKNATLREAKNLRDQGADVVLIAAHAGLFCDLSHTAPGHILRRPTDPQGECENTQEIVRLLKSIPAGTVDGVVSGHTHSVVYHYVAGVPVIQGGANGRYFNLIHLAYDLKQKKLVVDRTAIEGPIPVCPMVFKNQGDCNGDRPAPSIGRGNLIRPTFRKETIKADSAIERVIAPAIEAAKKIKAEVYGNAVRPIEHERRHESPMGNLIADAIRAAAQADFALINSGGIRAPFEQGPITFGEIFRTLPFENSLVVLTVTGKQLKQILRIGESGSRGFHPVSGLKLKLISPDADAPADDLDQDGKISPWEINRLLDVQTAGGQPIDDHKQYTLATIDFLVSGGDDYSWGMRQIPEAHRKNTGIMMRESVADYIRKLSAQQNGLNSAEHPLVNPSEPRMVFEKPKVSKKGKRGRSRHHKGKRKKKRATNH